MHHGVHGVPRLESVHLDGDDDEDDDWTMTGPLGDGRPKALSIETVRSPL